MGIVEKLKKFILQCKRVILVANKPDKEEFNLSAKITALGIAIVGVIGFVIFMIVQLIGGL